MRRLSELAVSVADAVTTTEERAKQGKQGLFPKVSVLLYWYVLYSRALRRPGVSTARRFGWISHTCWAALPMVNSNNRSSAFVVLTLLLVEAGFFVKDELIHTVIF